MYLPCLNILLFSLVNVFFVVTCFAFVKVFSKLNFVDDLISIL